MVVNSPGRRLFLLIAMLSLAGTACFGSNVELTNGYTYRDVTVLHRDATNLEIGTPYGKVEVQMALVEKIDSIRVRAAPTPMPVPAAAVTGTQEAATASPSATAAAAGAVAAGSPPASESPEESPTPVPPAWPAYEHRWNMDLILLAFAIFAAVWIGTAAAVRRSLFQRHIESRFWANMAIVLPVAGYLAYETVRRIGDVAAGFAAKAGPAAADVGGGKKKRRRKGSGGFQFLDENNNAIPTRTAGEQSGLDHAHGVLEAALAARASDVHIDPAEKEYLVRFRVDGIMQPHASYPREDGQRMVSALKSLAQIDVAERRKAQDGRFRVRTNESDVDFRVATANSIFGEKVVVRILDRDSGLLGLAELGMPDAMKEQFRRVIHARNGMILATGPTGSGKTSTIYSALSQLDASRLNIMTIEDPVEYGLAGATQIPVNPKAGTTYESGLRSILRQDPDVIFVGEMRDAEAAQVALRAALTGHLVFSSLHTRDAVGTVTRLAEMGIDRHLLASSLLVLIAQRLLRVLCPHCREACQSGVNDLAEIGIKMPAGETIYRAKGCKQCDNTGYTGRTGIFEMIVFDDALRQAVNAGENEAALAQIARGRGFESFRENGAQKILLGITSVEEVLQAS